MNSLRFLLILCISFPAISQDALKDIDMASFYQEGKELVVNKVAWEKNRLIVHYQSPRAEKLEVTLVSYKSYSSKKPVFDVQISSICEGNNCRFDVDMNEMDPELNSFLRFVDVESSEEYFEEVLPGSEFRTPVLITDVFEDIRLNRSFAKGTEVSIEALDGVSDIYVFFYDEEFSPADPPTGIRKMPPKDLSVTREFTIESGETLFLNSEGLYFFQTDPDSKNGYGIRVVSPSYPNYNSLDDLKNCMIYISTADEWKQLGEEVDKKTFDDIWLSAGGNENNARSAIRNYYRNIRLANTLFTTYKAGWKTDKGLIYTVFGPPMTVNVEYGAETWTYDQEIKGQPLKFRFMDKANFFTPYHSVLERNRAYGSVWHFTVDKVRKGVKISN